MGCFDSGGSKSQSYTGAQAQWLQNLLGIYGPQAGQGQVSYPGETVAPFSPTQNQAFGLGGDFLSQFNPNQSINLPDEYAGAMSSLVGGTSGPGQITPEQTQNFFSSVYEQPAWRSYEEDIKPQIQESFAGPGYWSGARAQEQSRAAGEMSNWLGEQKGQLDWNAMMENRSAAENAANRQLSALPLAQEGTFLPSGVAQQQLQGASNVFSFLEPQRQMEQANIQAGIQKFLESQRLTDPEDLQILLSLLGMNYSSSSSSGPGLGYAGTTSFLGGFGQGLGDFFAPGQ